MVAGKTVVTSWHEDQHALYGANFMKTFEKFWPKTYLQRVFYYEDIKPAWLSDNWIAKPLNGGIDEWDKFRAKLRFPIMRGQIDHAHYSMNFDAAMCRKIYMQMSIQEGKVFWIDGDVVTHREVTHNFLDELLPDDKLCSFLGRDGKAMGYTESGFIGFNTNHALYQDWRRAYLGYTDAGLNFINPGWHDCYVFDAVRRNFPEKYFNDLGKDVEHNGHVFVNSILGSVMDHLKGPRKTIGNSQHDDLLAPRDEPYWQGIPVE